MTCCYKLIVFFLLVCGNGNYSMFTGRYTFDRECRMCPIGSYSVSNTATICTPCPEGETTDQEGSTRCRPSKNIHF